MDQRPRLRGGRRPTLSVTVRLWTAQVLSASSSLALSLLHASTDDPDVLWLYRDPALADQIRAAVDGERNVSVPLGYPGCRVQRHIEVVLQLEEETVESDRGTPERDCAARRARSGGPAHTRAAPSDRPGGQSARRATATPQIGDVGRASRVAELVRMMHKAPASRRLPPRSGAYAYPTNVQLWGPVTDPYTHPDHGRERRVSERVGGSRTPVSRDLRRVSRLEQRRHALFTTLTVLDFCYAPGPELPLLPALRTWLGGLSVNLSTADQRALYADKGSTWEGAGLSAGEAL
jgi:hypothetical protein